MSAGAPLGRVIRACDAAQWDAKGRRIPIPALATYRVQQQSSGAPAIIFDRDGVLNVHCGYVYRKGDFQWTSGALDALRWLTGAGVEVFIATNQGGIGRGVYDEFAFRSLTSWMLETCSGKAAQVRAVYYCPHHPDAVIPEFRGPCHCRKPEPGQLEAAIVDHSLARDRVWFVGDSDVDMEAGRRAGVRTARYTGGSLLDLVKRLPVGFSA